MPDATILPLSGAKKIADLTGTALANSVMHLYKDSLTPNPGTPLADFTTAEADFSGYASVTITSVGASFILGASWAVEAQARFDYDSGAGSVGNQIGGWYWVSSAGVLMEYGSFSPTRPAQGDGQAIFVTAVLPITSGQVF